MGFRAGLLFSFFLCCAHAPYARAEDATVSAKASEKIDSLKKWFGGWKVALKKKAVQSRYRRGISLTSVAAVRGAKQADADPARPYWKGTWSDQKAANRLKEREEQTAIVDLIIEGKYPEAEKAMDGFVKNHPKSSYLAEIEEARVKLAELKNAEAAPSETLPAAPPAESAVAPAKPLAEPEQAVSKEPDTPPAAEEKKKVSEPQAEAAKIPTDSPKSSAGADAAPKTAGE